MTTATTLWISTTTQPGVDLTNFLAPIYPENSVHLQDKDDSDAWRAYNINGAVVIGAGYITLPVLYVQGGAIPLPAGQRMIMSVLGQHYIGTL